MQALRGIRWYDALPEDACDQSLMSAIQGLLKMSVLDDDLPGTIDAMLPSIAANEGMDAKPPHFDISCDPPKVTLPSLPILFQSPYAEQILREFRMPGNLLSSLYDTPYMRHFYSDAERERAYARWVRKD